MPTKTAIGAKILGLRRGLGLTQGELADKVGVSRAAISQFELGDTTPSAETQQKISTALGFDLSKIYSQRFSSKSIDEPGLYLTYFPITSYPSLVAAIGIYPAEIPNPNSSVYSELYTIALPGVDYDNSNIIEIKGDSMAPRYPHGSRYVITIVSPVEEQMKFLSGVCLFFFPEREPIFRRVISNKGGILTLKADATGEEIEVEVNSLCWTNEEDSKYGASVYKLGQAVHMPAE